MFFKSLFFYPVHTRNNCAETYQDYKNTYLWRRLNKKDFAWVFLSTEWLVLDCNWWTGDVWGFFSEVVIFAAGKVRSKLTRVVPKWLHVASWLEIVGWATKRLLSRERRWGLKSRTIRIWKLSTSVETIIITKKWWRNHTLATWARTFVLKSSSLRLVDFALSSESLATEFVSYRLPVSKPPDEVSAMRINLLHFLIV
jgi:hypothetical protein